MKTKGRIAVILSCCLLLQAVGKMVPVQGAASTEALIPMAEYYQKVIVEGKKGTDVAWNVGIADWQDFLLFRECLNRKNATNGVRFVQQKDIKASDASFSYDEYSDSTAVYLDGRIIGAIGRDKKVYKTLSAGTPVSLSSIGLGSACISNDTGSSRFYGTYDGDGYSICGVIFDSDDPYD